MAEIDSLEIQITASSRAAASAIDILNSKLGKLANSLNFDAPGLEKLDKINGSNIKNLGIGLNALGKGLQSIQGIQRIDFGKVARDIGKIASIPAGNLETIGNAMRPLADGINALSKAKVDNANLTNLINSLTRLSNANLSNLNGANFTQLGTSIKEFANAVSGADKVEQYTIAMTNAVSKLANAGKNIGKVTGALPHLANSLKGFMNTMSGAPQVANETITFAQAIGTLASAGDKTKSTASNLKQLGTELKNFMQTMSTAPNVSDSVIRMTTALSGLVNQGGRVTLSSNSISSSFSRVSGLSGRLRTNLRNLTGSMSGLSGAASKTASSFKGFLRQLMSAAGVYFSIYGAIRGLKSAIDISSDLTEVQNVVDVAFGNMAYKMEEFTKNSVKDFGMSELTAKQIGGRYQAMATAIGVSADKISQANTFLSRQTKGYVAVSDSMADVSVNLTKLAADMASFYNVEQTDVAKSLESVFTGTTAPLRRYGLDLTQATLSEWAMKQGLDADIKSMSQAEKTMLRYQYVLANTTAAQGDFARTADSWANQTRVLVQQLEILGSVVGGVLINAFKPLVKTLNAVMTKVISFAKTIADALGTIFGWTFEVNPGGMTNDFGDMSSGIEDVADGADDAKDNLKDTNKEAKDLKDNLQGLDRLNVISLDKDKDKDKSPSSGKGSGAGTGAGGIGGLDTSLFETESILKKYESSIDTLYKLGKYIGDALTKALDSINWDKVYAKAEGFGRGLAEFLNGLISPELFSAVGRTIAGALNTALHALDSFGATFDWENLGISLAEGLASFLTGIDWETALSTAKNWGTGIAKSLNKFISPELFAFVGDAISKALNTAVQFALNFAIKFDFENLGNSLSSGLMAFLNGIEWDAILRAASEWGTGIAKALNSFISPQTFELVGDSVATALNAVVLLALDFGRTFDFKNLGNSLAQAINRIFYGFNFTGLAKAINAWVNGILDTVIVFLNQAEWGMIGVRIGTFLEELDFTEIGGKVGQAIWKAINAGIDLFKGMFSKAPIETAIISAFALLKFTGIGSVFTKGISKALSKATGKIKSVVASALKKALLDPISKFFTATLIPSITGLFSTVGSAFGLSGSAAVAAGGGVVVAGIVAAVAAIKDLWDTSEIFRKSVVDAFENIKKSVSDAFGKVSDAIKPMVSAFSDLGKSLSDFYQKGFLKPVVELFASLAVTLGGAVISTAIDVLADAFSGLARVLTGAVEVITGVLDALNGIIHLDFEQIIKGVDKVAQGILDAFSGILGGIIDIGADIISGLLKGILSGISNIGSWLKKNVFDPFVNSFKNLFGIHSPSTVMAELGKFIMQGLLNGISGMIKKVTKIFTDIKNSITKAWDEAKKKTTEAWTTISNKVNETWGNMKSWATDKFSNIKSSITGAWDKAKEKTISAWTTISNKVNEVWGNIKSWASDRFSSIKKSITDTWDKAKSKTTSAWSAISQKVNETWGNMKSWASDKFSKIRTSITNAWDKAKTKTQSIWGGEGGIPAKISSAWSSIKKSVSNALTGESGIVGKLSAAWTNIKKTATTMWKQIADSILSPIKKAVNGVISGINWVLGKVGSKKKLSLWDAKGYARGSGGIPEDTFGIVNDQKGSAYRELIVPPHGKPFIPKGRNVMLPLEKGTKIMPAMETKRFISGLPHFEGGIGDFIGGAWEKVKNFTGQILDYISEPKKIVQIAIDKFTNMAGVLEPMLSIAKGTVSTIAEGATSFVKKVFDEELKVDYKVGAGVQQWAGLAAKALQITGQYTPANLSYLLQQMHHESRGNPNAINLWDSNAKKGTPSKGLMQVIDPTFRANAMPPYNKNIYDPLSNMIAAIRYTVRRYGSLYKGWAARGFKGYAEGIGKITLSDVIPGYANGGFPASGQLFMARENGIPEMVGKIGSRPAVANNEQITDAVAKGVSQKLNDTSKEFEDIMKQLAKSIKKSFEDAESKSGADQKSISDAAGQVSKVLENAMLSVETEFSKTGEVSRNEMQSLLSKTKEIIERTKAQSSENAAALSSIYQDISTMASSAFDKLTLAAQSYNDYAKNAVKETDYKANVELEIESGMDDEAYEAGQNAVSSFSEGMQNYISDAERWVNSMRENALNGFNGMAGQMQIYGNDAVSGYDYGIGSGYDDLENTVYDAASGVSDGFSGIEADVIIDGSNVITGLQEGMASQWEQLTEWLNERKEELSASLYEIGDYMKPIGERIVTELIAGIESLWGSVEEWSANLKEAFTSAQTAAAALEQEQTRVSETSAKSKVSDAAKTLKTNTKQYKEADFLTMSKFNNKIQTENINGQYIKYSTQAGNDIKNQNARDMSVSMISAMNQVLVPALQKIGNPTIELKGDAKGMFDAVVKQNNKYKTITGASAL